MDAVGAFNLREIRNRNPKFGKHNRPNLFFPIYVNPKVIDSNGHSPISLEKSEEFSVEVLPMNSTDGESCWRWGRDLVSKNASSETLKCNAVAKKKLDGSYSIFEKYRKETFKPKSIWDDNAFLTETGTVQLKELGLGNKFDFPKPIELVSRCAELAADSNSLILDYFAGSGTTGHATLNLNRADGEGGKRRFVLCEMGGYFESVLVKRLQKAAFADKWRDGKPVDFSSRKSAPLWLWTYRLESYEDALEHLGAQLETGAQLPLPDDAPFRVRYGLHLRAQNAETLPQSLFDAPFSIEMHLSGDEAGQGKPQTVNAVATFNWLLGLRVQKQWYFSLAGKDAAAACGLLPDGNGVVVVWRTLLEVAPEKADSALLEWWENDEILVKWRGENAIQTVYLNGDSSLESVTGTTKVELLEAAFCDLMFGSSRRGEGAV